MIQKYRNLLWEHIAEAKRQAVAKPEPIPHVTSNVYIYNRKIK
ncbi:MAG: hypothetical protein WC006_03465 [Bacilli bacterium]